MQKNIEFINSYFEKLYPNAQTELQFDSTYQLLVAVILSAQCTDKRVNIVTKELFKVAPTPSKMIELGEERLKSMIHSCGFYNAKAKSIISATNDIIQKFNGQVPTTIEELTSLRGVGRKTANVVLLEAFKQQTVPVDTHVLRVSKRLGLTTNRSNPIKCENDLMKILPEKTRGKFHHQMIFFGRYKCKAIKPSCADCELKDICKYNKNKEKKNVYR